MTVIEVTSLSRANDLSLVALADLASATPEANLDHRIFGGMLTLHLHLASVRRPEEVVVASLLEDLARS